MSNVKTWDVLGLGAVAVDELIYVDHYPEVDTKEPVKARGRVAGGLAGNALATASRLGASAAYFGVLGEDDLSKFTLQEFERIGVDCSTVIVDPAARPIHSTVIVENPTGARTIYFDLSGLKDPSPDLVNLQLIQRCKVLFVDHTLIHTAIKASRLARQSGIPVLADIERGKEEHLNELLNTIDHLVIGIEMGRQLTGYYDSQAIVQCLAENDYQAVVVTVGAQGCYYAEADRIVHHQPALKVKVVETIGCGDIFHGAYAAGIAWGMPVSKAILMATVTAGVKAGCSGGRPGIPDLLTVQKIMKESGEEI